MPMQLQCLLYLWQLDINYIDPDFIVADIKHDGHRHIVLATSLQLDVLRQSRRWFMDGTFKVRRGPQVPHCSFSIVLLLCCDFSGEGVAHVGHRRIVIIE